MTSARRIGNQENSPNTTSSGSRNANVLSPSRVRRKRGMARRRATRSVAGIA